jgi:hypothetical protein
MDVGGLTPRMTAPMAIPTLALSLRLVLASCVLTACAQSHTDHPLASTLEWLPAVLCERAERCSSEVPWGLDGSCEAWMRTTLANQSIATYEGLIALGRAEPSDDARARCEAGAAGACDWTVTAAYFPDGAGALGTLAGLGGTSWCPEVIDGLGLLGEACRREEECAGVARCRDGVCQAPLGEGESGCFVRFGFGRSDCDEGLTCIRDEDSSMPAHCGRLPPIGSACAVGQTPACAIGAVCEDGACVAIDETERSLGQHCSSSTSRCAPGLVCAANECVLAPLVGEPCVPPESDLSARACAPGLQCGDDGLCTVLGSEGDACDGLGTLGRAGRRCGPLLGCIDGACVRGRELGETCAVAPECISFGCTDGTCEPVVYPR